MMGAASRKVIAHSVKDGLMAAAQSMAFELPNQIESFPARNPSEKLSTEIATHLHINSIHSDRYTHRLQP